ALPQHKHCLFAYTTLFRSATTPDVGADEFTGTPLDLSPPNISYIALGSGIVTGTRTFTPVTVTDASGVNTSAGTRPRCYYKKTRSEEHTSELQSPDHIVCR